MSKGGGFGSLVFVAAGYYLYSVYGGGGGVSAVALSDWDCVPTQYGVNAHGNLTNLTEDRLDKLWVRVEIFSKEGTGSAQKVDYGVLRPKPASLEAGQSGSFSGRVSIPQVNVGHCELTIWKDAGATQIGVLDRETGRRYGP